ncbi:MAG TPA: LytTR family DNA-binding domain-containing protein [Povalibacter sp.]|nr:LytTR family DNA-binding domain-containing protein [Povalibacter sp.]
MQLKILIVDDEPLAREGLKLMVGRQPAAGELCEARNGREAVALIRNVRPDMVLLDVQMPGMNGFEVVDAVGAEAMPAVVFVTAHDQYAMRAFEISAVDYLLKPVSEERFNTAFDRAARRIQVAPADESTHRMMTMLDAIANPRRYLSRFAIRSGELTIFVPVDTVDWIEALQNYVRLHTGETTHLLHVTMNALEASLDPACFLRIHRSHIVNVQRIRQLWSLPHGQYLIELLSGERLQSGRTYGDRVRNVLSNPF